MVCDSVVMARIEIIPDDSWDGALGDLYPRVVDPAYGRVDNIMAVHSLNPAAWLRIWLSTSRRWPAPPRSARSSGSSSPWW